MRQITIEQMHEFWAKVATCAINEENFRSFLDDPERYQRTPEEIGQLIKSGYFKQPKKQYFRPVFRIPAGTVFPNSATIAKVFPSYNGPDLKSLFMECVPESQTALEEMCDQLDGCLIDYPDPVFAISVLKDMKGQNLRPATGFELLHWLCQDPMAIKDVEIDLRTVVALGSMLQDDSGGQVMRVDFDESRMPQQITFINANSIFSPDWRFLAISMSMR
ncbi:MAG: hypothetical protein ACOYUZ_05305 [Patescibacteria group bacterium]